MALTTDTPRTEINEWTVMFFLAADGDLSPLIVSQLKAIKEAGYQENSEVLVYFDSSEKGVPTRLYNVNHHRKAVSTIKTEIGDGEDSYVRNLAWDDIAPEDFDSNAKALDALKYFVNYGRKNHKAKHYMLFLVGHGMIVGNDAFLPDESPKSAITLPGLREVLSDFSKSMEPGKETFELLALHSCSMSALEVAYELKGTAKYMMASEGLSYVGSWPYRQLLKKIFKTIDDARKPGAELIDVDTLIQKLYFLSLFNSTDFMLSGFSSDLSLCNLDPTILKASAKQLVNLVGELKEGLDDAVARELIVLAHAESQSYWNESYTDLYDFCRCLREGCKKRLERYSEAPILTSSENALLTSSENALLTSSDQALLTASNSKLLNSLRTAGDLMIAELEKKPDDPFSSLVIFSEHFGPKYQYSHGLSVYFPWAEPVEDPNEKVMKNYGKYLFTTDFRPETKNDLADQSWLSFIEKYCIETRRDSRLKEDKKRLSTTDISNIIAAGNGMNPTQVAAASSHAGALEQKASGSYEGKASPAVGAACACQSIKNYVSFSISPAAALAFKEDSDVRFPERRRARRQSASQRST